MSPFLAQVDSARAAERVFYEVVPLLPMTAGWQGLLAVTVVGALLAFVVWMYRRDGVELPHGITITLAWLRIAAIAAMVVFFINPEKRTERRLERTSRLPVLIDTSSSMGIRDRVTGQLNPPSRMERVVELLRDGQVLDRLRRDHEVVLQRFDAENRPEELAVLPRRGAAGEGEATSKDDLSTAANWVRIGSILGLVGLGIGAVGSILRMRSGNDALAWLTLVGAVGFVGGYIALSLGHLQSADVSPWQLLAGDSSESRAESNGQVEVDATGASGSEDATRSDADQPQEPESLETILAAIATTDGEATRLGDALRHVIGQERGGPIAGVVVVTDGRRNAGSEVETALAAARDAGIRLVVLGAGSADPLRNVAVAEIVAPKRVFPSDRFQVRGLIRSSHLGGESVGVRLVSRDEAGSEADRIEGEMTVELMPDDSPVPVAFDVSRSEQGKRVYELQVVPGPDDFDATDDARRAVVEVIERKNRVLIVAGGPTREYQFLRNQLFRDTEVISDVWLQSATEGVAQEADSLLTEFPGTREAMYAYDCVIAFDVDWRRLTPDQCRLLETWVAEQGGGLVVIAGPVFTPEWTREARGDEGLELIRKLYPVSFFAQGSGSIKTGRFGGERPFPVAFSREGRTAEFLWLADSAEESEAIWRRFDGVFGYYAVNEAKPGATVFGNFSDPATEFDGRLPIYFAGQYYGAGRVFFQASGEMWRLREVEVEAFERYYTKLVRWASQGRLARDSTRGVLLVDRERCWIGDRIDVQAMLRDESDQPLALSEVRATVLMPDRSNREIVLTALTDGARPGTFVGQLPIADAGEHRISLLVPGGSTDDVLTATVRADIPDLERDQAERNDALLTVMAERTEGRALIPLPSSSSDANLQAAWDSIPRADLESYLPGTPDSAFTRALMGWLLGLVVCTLCLEWLTRRLHRLA